MLSINYDISLGQYPDGSISVRPLLDPAYLVSRGQVPIPYLCVTNQFEDVWQWPLSTFAVRTLQSSYDYFNQKTEDSLFCSRQVLHNNVNTDSNFYEEYAKSLFSSIRCGASKDEMTTKLYSYFMGSDWADTEDMFRGILERHTPTRPLLRCQIEPLYGTIQPILPPYEVNRKKHIDLKTWKPSNPLDYQIVWHLLVTLSNGEQYKMYYPICSINRWHRAIEQYFNAHPQATLSPYAVCGITSHKKAYDYERVVSELQFFSALIYGVSVSEILIKLSNLYNYPERPVHLQKILTSAEVELVFSGKTIWGNV